MKHVKYYYDKKTLSFKRIEKTLQNRIKNILFFVFTSSFFAVIILLLTFKFIDSPKEKILKRELDKLKLEYELIDKDLVQISAVLENIKDRDDDIYRVIPLCLRHRLRKDPLESIDSGDKVRDIFKRVFGYED